MLRSVLRVGGGCFRVLFQYIHQLGRKSSQSCRYPRINNLQGSDFPRKDSLQRWYIQLPQLNDFSPRGVFPQEQAFPGRNSFSTLLSSVFIKVLSNKQFIAIPPFSCMRRMLVLLHVEETQMIPTRHIVSIS